MLFTDTWDNQSEKQTVDLSRPARCMWLLDIPAACGPATAESRKTALNCDRQLTGNCLMMPSIIECCGKFCSGSGTIIAGVRLELSNGRWHGQAWNYRLHCPRAVLAACARLGGYRPKASRPVLKAAL
ncbi:unnamed protein product [Polarella glacialis]|uniref:Uncharacterized protein n=1 Tax=Polarella glacialis TaxID=89957 RepID=A0A813K180_POLGL|nr:unnamed protein product [Polarella glacialis]